MKKTLSIFALIAAGSLALSGCAESGTVEKGGAANTSSASSAPADKPAEQAAEKSDPQFGDKFVFDDGLALSITKPEAFKPSEYAMTGEGKHVIMTVTLDNGTSEDYKPSLAHFTASSGGEEAEQIFDSQNKLDGGPSTTVKPGKSVKFKIGFSVADVKDITLDASPGFDHKSITFVN